MLFDDDQTWLYEQYLVVLNATAPYTPLGVSHVIPFCTSRSDNGNQTLSLLRLLSAFADTHSSFICLQPA
jgi:hypothetical protein